MIEHSIRWKFDHHGSHRNNLVCCCVNQSKGKYCSFGYNLWHFLRRRHRDRTRACMLCCFGYFFPHLNMQKTCWLWALTTLITHQKVWFFSHLTMNDIVESCFYCKKTPNLIKKLFLCYVAKPIVGPVNMQCDNFKWGNIFCGHLHSSLISMGGDNGFKWQWQFWQKNDQSGSNFVQVIEHSITWKFDHYGPHRYNLVCCCVNLSQGKSAALAIVAGVFCGTNNGFNDANVNAA